MTIEVVLGVPPFFQFTDNDGKWLTYGTLETLDWYTREPKATWQDPGATILFSNPMDLDGVGRTLPIFWEIDSPYYLVLRDFDGNQVFASPEPYYPQGETGSSTIDNIINAPNLFINGQFRFYPKPEYSPIPASIPVLAYGGWSWEKNGTNANNQLIFVPFAADNSEVVTSPKNYLNYIATSAGSGETINDLVYTVFDVRTLAGTEISVIFDVETQISGTYTIELLVTQYFGTSSVDVTPSATVTTSLGNVVLTTAFNTWAISGTIPTLIGKTIGINGDDTLAIRLRFPRNSNANIAMTNMYWKRGAAILNYPYQTSLEVDAQVKALLLPDFQPQTTFDNFDFPTVIDDAYTSITTVPLDGVLVESWESNPPISTPIFWLFEFAPPGYVLALGQALEVNSQYNRLYNYKPLGAPKIFGTMWGEPEDNTSATVLSNVLHITDTKAGVPLAVPDIGTTTFTIVRRSLGYAALTAGVLVTATTTFTATVNGTVTTPAVDVDSTMTINVVSTGSGSTPAIWNILAKPVSGLTAGKYFVFDTTTTNYYVWIQIDNVGTDPAVGGRTGIKLNLATGMTDVQVGKVIKDSVSGYESIEVTTTAPPTLEQQQYWDMSIVGTSYRVWYQVDGFGDAPTPDGRTLLRVKVLSTDTAAQVATKTLASFNPLRWQMPSTQGYFPRFWDDGAGVDPDAGSRTDRGDGTTGDHVGTLQDDENKAHTHAYTRYSSQVQSGGSVQGVWFQDSSQPTGSSGGAESRPKNMYFALAIKY